MSKVLIVSGALLLLVATVSVGSLPTHAQPSLDKAIAAETLRLGDSNPEVQLAAMMALRKIGKPAVPTLIKALACPNETVRARAAEVLRPMLAADPTSDPNYHDETYWLKRFALIKNGTKFSEVMELLGVKKEEHILTIWDGTGNATYRLDDYWTVNFVLGHNRGVDFRKDGTFVIRPPELKPDARQISVAAPKNFTGTWTTWRVNGQKAQEMELRRGNLDGVWTHYHDNGQKSYDQRHWDGVPHGPGRGWSRSGKKMYELEYRNGKRAGVSTHWFENGEIQHVSNN